MRTKFTIFLILANILLFSTIYFFEHRNIHSSKNISSSLLFIEGEISHVDRIALSGEDLPEPRILEHRQDGWYITSPIEWPANEFAVQRILTQLQFLEKEASFPVKEVTRSGHTLTDYGLDHPKLVLQLQSGSKSIELKIGDPTLVGNRMYILSAEGDYIFVMNKDLMESLSINIEDLRSQKLFDIPLFEIRSMTVQFSEPSNLKVRLVEQDQNWFFESPIHAKASKKAAERLLSQLSSAHIRSFISDPKLDPQNLGLDTPWLKLSLYGNNRKQTLLLGNEVPKEQEVSTKDEKEYYAKLEGLPTLFKISAGLIDDLKTAQVSLRESKIMNQKTQDISEIAITQNDKNVQLQRLETGSWQVLSQDKDNHLTTYAADDVLVTELLRSLEDLEVIQFVTDAPSQTDLERFGFTQPQRTLTLASPEGKTKFLFGNFDLANNLLYAKLDAEGSVYEVGRKILNLIPARPLHYRTRLLEQWPQAAQIKSIEIVDLDKKNTVYAASIDAPNQNWSEALISVPETKRTAIISVLEQIKSFRVADYLTDYFSQKVQLDANTVVPWRYVLKVTLYLPGSQNSEKIENVEYYFSERLGGSLLLGGSERHSMTFTMPQEFIDAWFMLTFDKKPLFQSSSENAAPTQETLPSK
jgi:hypothetical protein